MRATAKFQSSALALFSLACAVSVSASLFATEARREPVRNVAIILSLTCGTSLAGCLFARLNSRWPLTVIALFSAVVLLATLWWPYALSTGALVVAALVRLLED